MISIVVTLIVIGVLLWLEETYIPMAAPLRTIIRAVVVIAVVLWLLQVFGLLGALQVPIVRIGPR